MRATKERIKSQSLPESHKRGINVSVITQIVITGFTFALLMFFVTKTSKASPIDNLFYPDIPSNFSYINVINESLTMGDKRIGGGDNTKSVTKSKIIITGDGEVLSSSIAQLDKGKNIFKAWSGTTLYSSSGKKLGQIQQVADMLNEGNPTLLFKNSALNMVGLIRKAASSLGTDNTAHAETFELAAFEVPEISTETCIQAVDCALKGLTGIVPGISICQGEAACGDACGDITTQIMNLLGQSRFGVFNFDSACSDIVEAIEDILSAGEEVIAGALVEFLGCFFSCHTSLTVDLNKACTDLAGAEAAVLFVICEVSAATGVNINQGLTTGIENTDLSSSVSISGEFQTDKNIDLANSKILITDLLSEQNGAGELTKRQEAGIEGDIVIPITLPFLPESSSGDIFVFGLPPDIQPSFQMTIQRKSSSGNTFDFHLDVIETNIPKSPNLCGNDLSTELITSFIINDGLNPVRVTTVESWECDSAEPNTLSIAQGGDGNGGCSISGPADSYSVAGLLLILMPLIFVPLRRFIRRLS